MISMSRHAWFAGCFALCGLLGGCSKEEPAAGSTAETAKASSEPSATAKTVTSAKVVPAGTTAAPPATPSAAPEGPPTKPIFESLTIVAGAAKPDKSSTWDVKNDNTATIAAIFFQFYAYDDAGKQIGSTNLSWNGELKPGATDNVSPYDWDVGKTAAAVEMVYYGVKFKGQDKVTTDDKRAPSKKEKGVFPGGSGPAADPAASASAAPADSAAPAASGLDIFAGDYITDYGKCTLSVKADKIKGICPGRGTVLDCKATDETLDCAWSESSGSGRAKLKRDPKTGKLNGSWGNGGSSAGGGSWTFSPKKK